MDYSSIPKAEVQCRCSFNPFQCPIDDLYPVRFGFLRSRLQVRFINLYYVSACSLQAFDLLVDCCSYIQRQGFFIAIIVILRLLCDGERPRNGDLDAMVAVASQKLHVAYFNRVKAANWADDPRHKVGMACAIQGHPWVIEVHSA